VYWVAPGASSLLFLEIDARCARVRGCGVGCCGMRDVGSSTPGIQGVKLYFFFRRGGVKDVCAFSNISNMFFFKYPVAGQGHGQTEAPGADGAIGTPLADARVIDVLLHHHRVKPVVVGHVDVTKLQSINRNNIINHVL